MCAAKRHAGVFVHTGLLTVATGEMSGWSISGAATQNLMADKLPEQQRGRVSALTGLMTEIAPVIVIGIAYAVSPNTLLVCVVPGVIGAVFLALFPLIKPEGSSRDLAIQSDVTAKALVASYGFNVPKDSDFAWNCLGRFVFRGPVRRYHIWHLFYGDCHPVYGRLLPVRVEMVDQETPRSPSALFLLLRVVTGLLPREERRRGPSGSLAAVHRSGV